MFRGSRAASGFVRTFTNSHFDHVAMVLKFDNDQNDVYMVEATANLGVALNKWSLLRDHIGKEKFWAKIVFRHPTWSGAFRQTRWQFPDAISD